MALPSFFADKFHSAATINDATSGIVDTVNVLNDTGIVTAVVVTTLIGGAFVVVLIIAVIALVFINIGCVVVHIAVDVVGN